MQSEPKRNSGLKGLVWTAVILALVIGTPAALFWKFTSKPNYDGLDGAALFRHSCMICHGSDGRATSGGAPSYRGVRKDWDAEKLLAYIDDPDGYKRANRPPRLGKRYMPPVDRFMPEDARRRLVEHVLKIMTSLEVLD